jgi:predicted DNA-binding protein with PD1-like motif
MDEVVGTLGRVMMIRLKPREDILLRIYQAIREHKMKAGVILSITGAVTEAVLMHPVEGQKAAGVVKLEGNIEVSGTGVFGWTVAPGHKGPFGTGRYVDGEPYVHVHLAVTSTKETLCGHMLEGCLARSNHDVSHFTIIMAEALGMALEMRLNEAGEKVARGWGVYHELRAIEAPAHK